MMLQVYTYLNMAILNILSASETLYHKRLRRYIHFKGAWPFSAILHRIDNFSQFPSYSLGSNYLKSAEISSPNESAYNFEPGPRLICLAPLLVNYSQVRKSHTCTEHDKPSACMTT